MPAPIKYMLVERQPTINSQSIHPTQRDILYVACEEHSKIYVLRGARELITTIDTSRHMKTKSGKMVQLLKIGQYLLVCFEHAISIYDTLQISESPFVASHALPSDSTLTCCMHLQTYLDKIIIGTLEGHLILYNFRVGEELHRFTKHFNYLKMEKSKQSNQDTSSSEELLQALLNTAKSDDEETISVSIQCVKSSPALDVIAVGLSSGHVVLYHLKYDHLINVFKQNGPVSCISFRTTSATSKQEDEKKKFKDIANSEEIIAIGNHQGEISLFDLNNHQMIHRISKPDRHTGIMTCCEFLPGEPIMITSSADNVLAIQVFDRVDKPREIVCRMGHKKAPKLIRFYDPMGNYIVTGGVDGQIRVTSLHNPKESRQISQADSQHLWKSKKGGSIDIMPSITSMDICYLRQDDWNNLACCHSNLPSVTLWNVKYLKSDNQPLYKSELKYGIPQAVSLSICGNYAVVGTSKGYLEKWIVQSKTMTHLFSTHDVQKEREVEVRTIHDFKGREKNLRTITKNVHNVAHDAPVNCVIIDNTNTKVLSGGHDGILKFWKFDAEKHKQDQLLASFDLKSPILKMVKSKNSASANFVSVATENFVIHVFDMNTCKLIRTFNGHHLNKINDMTFTHDNRYLVSCAMDNYILIYDILTGQLIDWLLLPKAATSVDFHPEGLYLVTTHVNSVGVCIWANKSIFGNAMLQSVNSPIQVSLPFSGDVLYITERSIVNEMDTSDSSKKKRKRAMKILSKVDDWINQKNNNMSDDEEDEDEEDEEEVVRKSVDTKEKTFPILEPSHYIKLSGLPKYKWHALTHLDELRKKNKLDGKKGALLEDLDVSKATPFFIPTVAGIRPSFSSTASSNNGKQHSEPSIESKILSQKKKVNQMSNALIYRIKLDKDSSSNNYQQTMNYLMDANTTIKELDLCVRTLSAFNNYEEYKLIMEFFLHYLEVEFTHFDLIQALINLFLQVHSELLVPAIRDDDEVKQFVERLSKANKDAFEPLSDMSMYNHCMIDFMSFGGVFI